MSRKVLDSVEKNVARLIEENRRLRAENSRSEVARERLAEENRRLVVEVAGLGRRLAVKELARGFAGEVADRKSTKLARARVNRLMREVDACIGLLSKES